jgi:hypothetical protein
MKNRKKTGSFMMPALALLAGRLSGSVPRLMVSRCWWRSGGLDAARADSGRARENCRSIAS